LLSVSLASETEQRWEEDEGEEEGKEEEGGEEVTDNGKGRGLLGLLASSHECTER